MHAPRCHPRWSPAPTRLPLRAYGLWATPLGRYAAPANGGETGAAYWDRPRPTRSGHDSRIHSAPARRWASTNPQLARPNAPAPTRSDRRRSRSSVGRDSNT